MHFQIYAEPGELEAKAEPLLRSLAEQLASVCPEAADVAELLSKAEQSRDPLADQGPLRFPVMRELHAKSRKIYQEQLDAMMKEIRSVIERE